MIKLLLFLSSPFWVPIDLLVLIALLIIIAAVVIVVALALLFALIFITRGLMTTHAWMSKLRNDFQSRADWRLRGPFETVIRAPGTSQHIAEMDADANAAYQNALMWCITGDEAHARKAIEILN